MKRKLLWLFLLLCVLFIAFSYYSKNSFGISAGKEFCSIFMTMIKILPCAFILIALFEEWCHRDVIIKHLGDDSGVKGYLWALLLGGMTIGGLFVAFPLAYTLHRKGASLKVIFSFLGFAGVCRIPMTLFEASFLGIKFTIIRLAVIIPLMLISGILIGQYLDKRNYRIEE
jgi:uncharacterized membrane protein YraQ (UPF0718 family)